MNTPNLDDILRRGEAEWMENAPDTYHLDAPDVWHTDVLPRFLSAQLEEIDVEDLRLFCPNMLRELKVIFAHDHIEDIRRSVRELLDKHP